MRQVERKPDKPRLVRIRLFLLGYPVDGVRRFHNRRERSRRNPGQRSDGRFFRAIFVGSIGAVLDVIVPIMIRLHPSVQIAPEEVEARFLGLHAGILPQTGNVPLSEYRRAVAPLLFQIPNERVMGLG